MEALIQLTIFLIVIILLARLGALFSRRFGLPAITIQLLIGILLGPSLLNFLGIPIIVGTWGSPPSSPLDGVLKILAEIGLIQLMFFAGLKTDWSQLKNSFKQIFSISSWMLLLTVAGIGMASYFFVNRWSEVLALIAIMVSSSFGISVYHFSEIGYLKTKVADLSIGASIFSSLLMILLMIASQAIGYGMTYGAFKMTIAVSWLLGKLIMFFAISYFLMSRFLGRLGKTGFEKRPRQTLIGYLLLTAALYAWAAIHFGSFAAVGVTSLGGALVGISNFGMKEKISRGLESGLVSLSIGVLLVVFGMEVNLKEVWANKFFIGVLLVFVISAKWIGSWITTRKALGTLYERFLIGIGTLPQGEMGMLIAAYLFSRGLINPSQFNIAIIVVVILTMIAPIVMKVLIKLSLRG